MSKVQSSTPDTDKVVKRTITKEHGKFDKLAPKDAAPAGTATGKKKSKTGKAKKAATKENLANAAKKATAVRESKYLYPANLDDKGKKEFRRKARAQAESFETELKALKKSTDAKEQKKYKVLKTEATAWKKATYASVPEEAKEG